MPVPTTIDDLSTTESSNSPLGTETPRTADNYLRAHASFIAQLRDDAERLELSIDNFGITPLQYGAIGDGVANDLAACNLAAEAARAAGGTLMFPPGYTFNVSGYIVIRPGVRRVEGRGGVIRLTATGGVLLAGIGTGGGVLSDPQDITVSGLLIDRNGQAGNGIWAANPVRCNIIFNRIWGGLVGHGIVFRSYASGLGSTQNNIIAYNQIDGNTSTGVADGSSGIDIGAVVDYAPYAGAVAAWKATFTASDAVYPTLNTQVINNVINGGYYGVSLSACRDCLVSGNRISNNVRNISVQNTSIRNTISENTCSDSVSSGIHLAYGSSNNLISANTIKTSRANGEGLLQAYVGCVDNVFMGNKVIADGASSPRWHIYCGIHSSRNKFIDNEISGRCGRAYVAVESAWDNTISNPASRGFENVAEINNFSNAITRDVVIRGNVFFPESAVPVVFLAQVNGGAACPLSLIEVDSNDVITSVASRLLEVYEENAGLNSELFYTNNKAPSNYTPTAFVLARGRAHFTDVRGSSIIDNHPGFFSFGNGDTTPSVAVGSKFQFSNSGATSVTMFDDGIPGQEIEVRGDVNTTIVHNASFIRCRGGVNITGMNADRLVSFRRVAGIWYEMWRNF
jgi:parallel beta-helix repeat protein